MSRRKQFLLVAGVLLVLAGGASLLIPTTRLMIVGYLRGEPFHRGRPVGFWIAQLQSDDYLERRKAALVLGVMGTKAKGAIPALTAALQDEAEVRREAAFALSKIGPDAAPAIPAVIEAVAKEPGFREDILERYAEILVGLGPDAIPELAKALKHKHFGTRFCAANALARFGRKAKEAIPALIEALKDPTTQAAARDVWLSSFFTRPDWMLFHQIAAALGEMGPDAHEAVPVMLAALQNGVGPVFNRGQPLRRIPYRDGVLGALGNIDPDLAALAQAYPSPFQGDAFGQRSDALGERDRLTILVGGLRHQEAPVRDFAAFAMTVTIPSIAPPSPPPPGSSQFREWVVAELTRALKDDCESVRWSAAIALVGVSEWHGQLGIDNRLALPLLIEALSKDKKHSCVRASAAYALGCIGHQRKLTAEVVAAAPALLEALQDPDDDVQWRAMFALAEVSQRPEHVRPVVRSALEVLQGKKGTHTSRADPLAVIELLGRIGPEAAAAFPLLLEMLNEPEQPDQSPHPGMIRRGPQPGRKEMIRRVLKGIDSQAAAKAGIN
jgi:HEAT repeat protein